VAEGRVRASRLPLPPRVPPRGRNWSATVALPKSGVLCAHAPCAANSAAAANRMSRMKRVHRFSDWGNIVWFSFERIRKDRCLATQGADCIRNERAETASITPPGTPEKRNADGSADLGVSS